MTDCWGVTNESWQIMYTRSGSFRKAKWLVHFLHAWTAMNGMQRNTRSQSNLTLLKKLELFRSGTKLVSINYPMSIVQQSQQFLPEKDVSLNPNHTIHHSSIQSCPQKQSPLTGVITYSQPKIIHYGGGYASKLPYVCIVWPLQNGWFKDLKSKGTKKLHIPLTSLQLNHGRTKVTSGPVLWRTGPRGSGDLGRTQLKLPRPPLLTNELGQKPWKMKVWYMIFPFQGLLMLLAVGILGGSMSKSCFPISLPEEVNELTNTFQQIQACWLNTPFFGVQ